VAALGRVAVLGCAWLLCGCAAFLLCGCAALQRARLRETEIFYRANSRRAFPPKPENTEVPVLSKAPLGSLVIGRFQFSTLRGSRFAMEAAKHNARKAGADALLLKEFRDWVQPYSYYQPPTWYSVPRTRWISTPVWRPGVGGGGRWETYRQIDAFPMVDWRPGYWVNGSDTYSIIDAEMLKWKE
jgi:hypothetical protein